MEINFKYINEEFKFNGFHYSNEDLLELAYSYVKEGELYQKEIGNFLFSWLNEADFVEVKTSGSTGKPKSVRIKKDAMVNSALATGEFFNLEAGNKALHCLPTQFIAGKMMLVRAMILGLEIDIVEPTSKPIFDYNKAYHFCAMIPLQLQNCLEKCNSIKTIIVGGASVSNTLKEKIQNIETNVYETYGMTETVTHIALKKLNNFPSLRGGTTKQSVKSYFKLLSNISISTDERDCLVINAPKLSEEKIITNDIVKIHSKTEFEWLGRFDNVINSGGLKLFPEQIEAKLHDKIPSRFFIASKPHDILGEQLILIIEENADYVSPADFSELDKHEKPKQTYTLKEFIETSSGKIHRQKTLELLNIS
ncbi:O-succinylbenzoic acid--CoA ligase [Mariniflexile fucanivorans]|uniref:O-succinylbenzoic acid--CoA ligase n=1 Tax=Mariniflexile fucanivorans TaxID=264023 RepID=A0A4R1RBM6_9FLAO|nr:AMP-binding protein [Mariniflexile fucanivorans]TCL63146.1 O-succinylbenzoic acid--CoA ligase [Mariniflexile fucanivorans]